MLYDMPVFPGPKYVVRFGDNRHILVCGETLFNAIRKRSRYVERVLIEPMTPEEKAVLPEDALVPVNVYIETEHGLERQPEIEAEVTYYVN